MERLDLDMGVMRTRMKNLMNKKGFTLLEVVVSMVVVAIGLLGIAAMMVTSVRANASAARLMEATNLAQDKIEELRNTPYQDLYGTCGGAGSWAGGDMTLCTNPPANMADSNAAVDNGTNGDETANDGLWTFQYDENVAGSALNNFGLIWGVQRNFPDRGLIKGFSKASWTDISGKVHSVNLQTILTNF
jgi:type IV pilus modification protein PilV